MKPKQGQDQSQPGQSQNQRSDQDDVPEPERPEADFGQGDQLIGRRHKGYEDQGRDQGRSDEERPGGSVGDKGKGQSARDDSPDDQGEQGRS
jgi:hypothetical protein